MVEREISNLSEGVRFPYPALVRKLLLLFFVLVSLASIALNVYFFTSKDRSVTFKVSKIIDGDTFVLADGRHVRLHSVDAPEINLCGGTEAQKELSNRVSGADVELKIWAKDKFGRSVATVYVDGIDVGLELLKRGIVSYEPQNPENKQAYLEASVNARKNKLGIYGELCSQTVNPNSSTCLIKGNVNFDTNKKLYHFPGCGRYEEFTVDLWRGDRWFCSEKEAKSAGFVKSGNCFDRSF